MYVGVDGCKAGWVAVAVDDAGFVGARVLTTFDDVIEAHRAARVLAVDIPIGLVDAVREVDRAVRGFLTGQASTVFPTPPRSALLAKSEEEAQRRARKVTGKGVSKQSLALAPKILEVDAHASDKRIHEAHPEVCFRVMNGGRLVSHRKKSWGGMQARLALLRAEGIELPASLGEADPVGIDDVIDAAAGAWTARRIAAGQAQRFTGDPAQNDSRGRAIAIWA